MQFFINTLPLLILLVIAFYSIKIPLQKAYVFENSSKLWLIHVVLVTGSPVLFLLVLSFEGLGRHIESLLNQFFLWHSNYGLLAGIVYVTPWLLHDFLFLLPPILAFLSYFLSPSIIRRYENLVPAEEEKDEMILSYKESISFFQNVLRRVMSAAGLPCRPSLYVKKLLVPNCYVFGKNSLNFSVVVTTGLLDSVKEGVISVEEVGAIVSHEIGHVLNSDLRLASSVKMFSDLKVIRFVIFGVFSALLLIYLSGIGLNLYYNPSLTMAEKLSKSYESLKSISVFIPAFLLLYMLYAAVEVLIRTTFKTREFFADVQALRILEDENTFVKTLRKISSPFYFLTA
ncbi:MAG: M48 family metalloprotease, partial [Pseudomonadota bacterium]